MGPSGVFKQTGQDGFSFLPAGSLVSVSPTIPWYWITASTNNLVPLAAALLWAAQGAIMMSYPLEKDKGRSFSLFWSIFQLGTLVGSAIALGIEAHSTLPSVSTGVYLAFMIIMLTAIVTSWLLLPPRE